MASPRVRTLLPCLALAALLGSRAEAASALRVLPSGGGALAPGGSAEVLFDATLLAGSDETELVLSLDGGASFPVRITRSQAGSGGRLRFRVPALPSAPVRLALRGGSEDGERLLAESDELAIAPDVSIPLEPLRLSAGEWRTREAEGGLTESPEAGFESPAPRVSALGRSAEPAPPRSPASSEPACGERPEREPTLRAPARIPAAAPPRLATVLPKRE
ncbi:MAG TPA: hypothetical protein VKF32_01075 [Thermoanaerobaculia bacterium]|nr:hypothetical protein [Thermoanaerobaculia bacterium]